MIRKATAVLFVILLGLYLPAAATSTCICVGPSVFGEMDDCCVETPACCEDENSQPCAGDPDCCVVIPSLPDGMEPQFTELPAPVAAPLPVLLPEEFVVAPLCDVPRSLLSSRAPPLPSTPVRITFGVWRL
jgi:hypothetical protein